MQLRIFETILPVFLSLTVGMLIRKSKLIDRHGMDAIRNLALSVTLPAVVFGAFASADYSNRTIGIPIAIFILSGFMLALGYVGKKIFHTGHCTPFLISGFEIGLMGYGLFALLFKGQSNSMLALLDLGAAAFVFTIYKGMATSKGDLKKSLLSAFKTTNLWAIIGGALVGATGLTKVLSDRGIFGIVLNATDFLGAPTGALILLGIGYDLDLSKIRWKRVTQIVVMRMAVMSVSFGLMYISNRCLLHDILPLGTMCLLFILPPPYVAVVFAKSDEERGDVSSALSVLTVICLVGFVVLSFLF